jgi:hypothetical protein
MFDDPIVLETRSYREAYAASLGYDLKRIVADLQSRQGRDGRIVVDRTSIGKSETLDAQASSAQPVSGSEEGSAVLSLFKE